MTSQALPSVITSADQGGRLWTVNDQRRQELPEEQGSGSWSRIAAAVAGTGRGVTNLQQDFITDAAATASDQARRLEQMQIDQFTLDEQELIQRAALAAPEGAALSILLELAEGFERGKEEHGVEPETCTEHETLVDSILAVEDELGDDHD